MRFAPRPTNPQSRRYKRIKKSSLQILCPLPAVFLFRPALSLSNRPTTPNSPAYPYFLSTYRPLTVCLPPSKEPRNWGHPLVGAISDWVPLTTRIGFQINVLCEEKVNAFIGHLFSVHRIGQGKHILRGTDLIGVLRRAGSAAEGTHSLWPELLGGGLGTTPSARTNDNIRFFIGVPPYFLFPADPSQGHAEVQNSSLYPVPPFSEALCPAPDAKESLCRMGSHTTQRL